MTPLERANRVARTMIEKDVASTDLGIVCDAAAPGTSVCHLQLKSSHANGHGTCHGGVIFTLADTAFAIACNSYNDIAVAQHNTISYIAPGVIGTTLTATATEASRHGRSGVYDVCVSDENGAMIALFRGCSRQIKGHVFDEENDRVS